MSKRGGKKRRYTGLLVFLIVVLVLCSVSIIILGILLYQKKVLADRGPSLPQIQSSVSTEETTKEMSTEAVIDEMTSQTEESVETASETAVQALEKPENKRKYTFRSGEEKVAYAKRVACRAANCAYFNAIPLSRMQAIYNDWLNKNEVDVNGRPELDYVITES